MTDHSKLVERLRVRAQIRRQIPTRKSVQEGKPDRIADLLEEAATALASRSDDYKRGLEDAAGQVRGAVSVEKQTPTDAPRPAPAAPALLTEGEIEDWFASETSTLHPSDDFEGPRLKLITSLRDMAQAYRRSQQGDCAMVPAKPVAWRWRYSQEHQWHYVEQEHQRSSQAYEWEPVFAAHKDTK